MGMKGGTENLCEKHLCAFFARYKWPNWESFSDPRSKNCNCLDLHLDGNQGKALNSEEGYESFSTAMP